MPTLDVPDFTLRKNAEKQYGRSKSSFIRDVDEALKRSDTDFLHHFRVYLNDGTHVEGPLATKEKIQSLSAKQPRWYIETAFLETRYWNAAKSENDSASPAKFTKKSGGGETSKQSTSSSGDELQESLERRLHDKDQEIQFLREQIKDQNEQLSNLSQRSQEDNVLLSKFQDLLDQSIRTGGLLVAPMSNEPTLASDKAEANSEVVDAAVIDVESDGEPEKQQPKKGTRPKRKVQFGKTGSKSKKQLMKKSENFWTKQRNLSDLFRWKS